MKIESDFPYASSLLKFVSICRKQLRLWLLASDKSSGILINGADLPKALEPICKKANLPVVAVLWQTLMYLGLSHTDKYGMTQNGTIVIVGKFNTEDYVVLNAEFFKGPYMPQAIFKVID